MSDDIGVQDGIPSWGTLPPSTAPDDPPPVLRPAGAPVWGTAQRPRGADRRPAARAPDPPDWREPLVPGALFLIGLAIAVPTLWGMGAPEDRADRVMAEGASATATVTDVRQWIGYRDLALRYEQAGRTWTVHRSSNDNTPPSLGVGDIVTVWVDPHDPGWAYATELDAIPAWGIDLVMLGLFLGGGSLLLATPMLIGSLAAQVGAQLAVLRFRRRRRRERPRG